MNLKSEIKAVRELAKEVHRGSGGATPGGRGDLHLQYDTITTEDWMTLISIQLRRLLERSG